MTRAVLLLFSVLAVAGATVPQAAPGGWTLPPGSVPVRFADRDLVIDRPSDWQDSGIRGGGVQLHFIGGPSGFPHFTVQSDAEAGLPADMSTATERQLVEELFRVLVDSVSGTTVLNARWEAINGLRVHASLSIRPSVAGPIKVRRLLFLHAGMPYVISWGAPEAEYAAIAAQVELFASSLQRAD